ncbi:MAG TPA: hypothetical protein VF875_14870, partial [Anaeromyxobacter sp.]
VLALLPADATFSMLGRTDHHVLESLLCTVAFLAFAWGLRQPERRRRSGPLLLAVTLALAFWNWPGSALYPLVLAAFTATWTVAMPAGDAVARRMARDLLLGCGVGAALLASSVALIRGPGALARTSLFGLSGLHPLVLLLVACSAGLLGLAGRWPDRLATWRRRLLVVVAAAALPVGLALAVPGFRDAVGHGLGALLRGNAWYRNVQEFTPILLGGWEPLRSELRTVLAFYGLGLVAMPLALAALAARLRSEGERAPVAFLVFWATTFLFLAVARRRFALYLAPPLAIVLGTLVQVVSARIRDIAAPRVPWPSLVRAAGSALLIGVLVGPALALLEDTVYGEDGDHRELRRMLERLRDVREAPGRPAVLSEWTFGHLVQYAAGRPVITSPFGTEGGAGAMDDAAAFFLADDEQEASTILERRRVGFIVLADPLAEVALAQSFAPGRPAVVRLEPSIEAGMRTAIAPEYRSLVCARIFSRLGSATELAPGLGEFRLLDESRLGRRGRGLPLFETFGVVPGARVSVEGARPGERVVATTRLTTPHRALDWSTYARADGSGRAILRIPYATGRNVRVTASPLVVASDTVRGVIEVTEEAVVTGGTIQGTLTGSR